MPRIDISDEVLAQIRALRRTGEESEDATLHRVLAAALAERDERMEAYEQADQDTQSTN